jgi:hypothetical protein
MFIPSKVVASRVVGISNRRILLGAVGAAKRMIRGAR